MTLRRAARRPVAALTVALGAMGALLAAPASATTAPPTAAPAVSVPAAAGPVAGGPAAAGPAAAGPAVASAGPVAAYGGRDADPVTGPVPVGGAVPATARQSSDEKTELDVEITDLGPPILRPDETLTVRGTIDNQTRKDAESPVLRLRLQRYTPVSRTALQRWMEPGSYSTTVVLAREELRSIPAGASSTFSVEVTPEELGLSSGSATWGPHGVEAAVNDTAGTDLAGADRSILLWYPDVEVEPTPVSVLVPITPTAHERTEASLAGTTVGDAAAPRLLELLGAVDRPGVTAAVDGSLLAAPPGEVGTAVGAAAARGGGEPGGDEATDDGGTPPTGDGTPGGTPESTDPPAPAPTSDGRTEPPPGWSALLDAVTTMGSASGREVAVLPWADADVAALAHTGSDAELARTTAEAAAAARAAGLGDAPVLTWPATARPDLETVAAGDAAGTDAAVLPVTAATPLDELTYTPESRADLVVGRGADPHTVPAVLVDDRASAVLSGQMLPRVGSGEDGPVHLDPLDARQLLLADTAVISRERPSDPRAVVLALPRDQAGDEEGLADTLRTLLDAPWVAPTELSAVVDREAPELERGTLPEREVDPDEIGRGELAAMDATVARARSFASVTASPEQVVDPVVNALEPALSAAWRERPAGRADLLDRVAAQVTALDSRLVALESSTYNLINSSAGLPVHVRNELSTDATVEVSLRPSDQRLQVPGPVSLTIPAASQASVTVPVRAVGSGDVTVSVELLGPDGRTVGTPADLRVRARPDWENVGTAVVAGVLAVMLVVGLVRTVRKGRRMDPDTPLPEEET
ncbi:hypothetical protein ATJ97_2312 [Georgenia soli]|uniref:Glycoprotein n=1 Tax=Georgenia soli TaxID=638953 RepID=A0A2A9EMG0_9MICO|nr:DUF6049 family protein [Georgenia soli]PFG39796.1 hypothetical protein ATJ97_2312 [Georgenia soli]